MKDKTGAILYVGKAKSLRHRVRSYFQPGTDLSPKTRLLVSKIADVEYLITDTEKEALILESTLIKKNKPRYNATLKDDKQYPYLRLSVKERYPRLLIVRRVERDGALYFGPYANAQAVRETLQVIHKIFPIRTCSDQSFGRRDRPCINFQLKRCLAPCHDKTVKEAYRKIVADILLFLRGYDRELLRRLTTEMGAAAQELDFEKAAHVRDQIGAIQKTLEKQKIVSARLIDQDIIAYFHKNDAMEVFLLFVRRGRITGNRSFSFRHLAAEDGEAMESFISQYYGGDQFIPDEIITSLELENRHTVEDWLSEKRGKRVRLVAPRRGNRSQVLRMAGENAQAAWENRHSGEETLRRTLGIMRTQFHLSREPRTIECFDISNLMGKEAVGSMVRFENGNPAKQKYRHYKIKTIKQANDYGMMYEVLQRRLAKGLAEENLPDLIVVDGGKGQLQVACRTIRELGIHNLDAIGLAKSRFQGSKRTPEKIFLPDHKGPLIVARDYPVLHLLQHIRDESHRFALAYHRKLRQKEATRSILDAVPGIGPAKKKSLLNHFGSLKKVQTAGIEELASVPTVSRADAQNIFDLFHAHEKPEKG